MARKKIREQILKTARLLYNRRGYGNVTLQEIADELGIAKGNLWYHFKDKRALLSGITEQYIEYLETRQSIWPGKGTELADYAQFLKVVAQEMQDFRFMYRDQYAYGDHPSNLTENLDDIYTRVLSQYDAFYRAFMKLGYLSIREEDVAPLVYHACMGLRYHLEFMRETGLDTEIGSGAVEHVFRQHLSIFLDKLSREALDFFEAELFEHRATASRGQGVKAKA